MIEEKKILVGNDLHTYSIEEVERKPEKRRYFPPHPSSKVFPNGYDGIENPALSGQKGMDDFLKRLHKAVGDDPQKVVDSFAQVVGPIFKSRSQAVGFMEGFLHVKVSDAITYSMFRQMEYQRILEGLRKSNPGTLIKGIRFKRC